MYSFIQDCLENEKDKLKLTLKYSEGKKILEGDYLLKILKKLGDNFRELISAKKASYQFLES
jgi:arsenate reductase-like glutaredoxin family protein